MHVYPDVYILKGSTKQSYWLLQIRAAEDYVGFPLDIRESRSYLYRVKPTNFVAGISCLDINHLTRFQISLLTVIGRDCWILIIGFSALSAICFKKLGRFWDLLLPLYEGSLDLKRANLCKGFTVVSMMIISLTYQSCISSESIEISDYRSYGELIREGFKPTVIHSVHNSNAFITTITLGIIAVKPNYIKDSFAKVYGKRMEDVLVDTDFDWSYVSKLSRTNYLRYLAKRKLIVSMLDLKLVDLYNVLGSNVWVIGDDLICKGFDGRDEPVEFPKSLSVRHWGHLSETMYQKHFLVSSKPVSRLNFAT